MKRNKLQERIVEVMSFHRSDVIHWISHPCKTHGNM
jgi:hypothetical protein